MKSLAFALPLLAILTACGGEADIDSDDSSLTNGSNTDRCAERPVRWLHEGNFWRVAYNRLYGRANIIAWEGDVDVGDYNVRLGKSFRAGAYTMYPLEVIANLGDTLNAPQWSAIGANRCGDIVGRTKDSNELVYIYVAATGQWTGRGFWGNVHGSSGAKVNQMSRGIIMDPSTYLKPPFIAIGDDYSVKYEGDSGCEYYGDAGLVCGSGDAGSTRRNVSVEYWTDTMGPVAYHDGFYWGDDDSINDHETRMEVFFFADNSDDEMQYRIGTNAIADAQPLLFTQELANVLVSMPEYIDASGTGSSSSVPREAVGMQHWFSFEITPAMAKKNALVFLSWTHDADYELALFGAPDSSYGFVYGGSGDPMPADYLADLDVAGAKNLSGQYQPGKYLLGVKRLDKGNNGDASFVLTTQID